jgi:hypothetical protein
MGLCDFSRANASNTVLGYSSQITDPARICKCSGWRYRRKMAGNGILEVTDEF